MCFFGYIRHLNPLNKDAQQIKKSHKKMVVRH